VPVRRDDPRLRLQRLLPGERIQELAETADRLGRRADWKDRPSPLPDRQRKTRTGEVRASSRRVDPSPNAPQLIRLVQHPFALDTVRPRKDPQRSRPVRIQVHDLERPRVQLLLRDALAEGRRLPFPSPTKVREPRLRQPRPRVMDWLRSVNREEGEGG